MKFLLTFLLAAILLNQGIAQSVDTLSAADPLIISWSVTRIPGRQINSFPFRGSENYLSLIAGVVWVNNELHIRGSRPYDTGYLLNGLNIANPFFGTSGLTLIPEAIEAIDVHTGAFGAELGSASGGIVATTMRSGGKTLEFSADIRTDDVVHPGSRFVKTTPLGYKNFVGTISGPVRALDGMEIRFFLAGEHTFYRNRQAMFLDPFRYDGLTDDGYWQPGNLGRPLPSSVEFGENWIPDNWLKRTTIQGNTSLQYDQIRFKVLGSYDEQENLEGIQWPYALPNYFNQKRSMLTRATTKFGAAEIGYNFSPLVSAKAAVYLYDRFERTFDRDLRHNWFSYPDSAANARFSNTSKWIDRYSGPDIYSTIYAFHFTAPNTPNNTYSKNRQSNIGVSVDLHAELRPELALNVGIKFDSWKMRLFTANNISNLRKFLDDDLDGIQNATFASDYERRIRYLERGLIEAYGYTFEGNETDGYVMNGAPAGATLDKPYKSVFGSAFASAHIRSSDLDLVVGLRYEYFDAKFKNYERMINSNAGGPEYDDVPYNVALGIIDETVILDSEPVALFLPRLNAQFVLDERTTLFAGYGRYAQLPRLDFLYMSSYYFSRGISPEDRSPYGGELAFEVRPEESTQFELGIHHFLNSGILLGASLFRKSLSGQVQIDQARNSAGDPIFTLYRNNGQGVSRGVELSLELTRSEGFTARAQYAFSAADGSTSHPLSNARQVSDNPLPSDAKAMYPYDYEQTHRASVLAGFRVDDENDPVFDGLDFIGVLTFNSGHPFTREAEVQNIGPYGPWDVGVKSLRDIRFVSPVEPMNQSSTPMYFNVDLRVSKRIRVAPVAVTVFLNILNVFNAKNVINVYPTTGAPNDDSWFSSPIENTNFSGIPNYEAFYRDINLRNRWAYTLFTGNDLYSTPRQIQFGVNVEM